MKRIAISNRMKPRRRLISEKEILAKIDDCHVRSRRALTQAGAVDRKADEIFSKAASTIDFTERSRLVDYGDELRAKANKFRKAATRLIEVRAHKLGKRLSEFRTELLPVHGVGDASVPMI